MSSAQVLPSSRKQELQEAGRRKLEEFRKKKAAKKASSNNQNQHVDGTIAPPSTLESEGDVLSRSNGPVAGKQSSQENLEVSFGGSSSNISFPGNNPSSEPVQIDQKSQDTKTDNASGSLGGLYLYDSQEAKNSSNDLVKHSTAQHVPSNASTSNYFTVTDRQASQNYNNEFNRVEDTDSKESGSSRNGSIGLSPEAPLKASGNSTSSLFMYGDGVVSTHGFRSFYEDSRQSEQYSQRELETSERQKPVSPSSVSHSNFGSSIRSSEPMVLSFDATESSPFSLAQTGDSIRRSRPSFLDSLNVPRASIEKHFSEMEKPSHTLIGAQSNGVADLGASSNFQKSSTGANVLKMFEQSESGLSSLSNGPGSTFGVFQPPKQSEDFTALEQHIEDLTQEKFSLQRALEASRALAESLAAENSSLTDSYNQQRQNVNQLKADMEALQEEIKAQLAELEVVRNEYGNAQLECNAADERAKILAAEVIGLEEKALRLRSNELKLERELENSQSDLSSYKKRLSSLEKERQDLQSTINALQEEKKVLQSKLRKASSGVKALEVGIATTSRKDKSTSTEDLGSSNQEIEGTSLLGSEEPNSTVIPQNDQPTLEMLAMNIPPDQMRVIQNIDTLISELAMEKEELTQALSSELSQSAKLKELNKELSRKLEAQTQRLELLMSQSMVNDSALTIKQPDSHSIQENAVYADEGDEVVERVLGWIMKLFPGGPSRRRTSKLL